MSKRTDQKRAFNERTYCRLAVTIPKERKADVEQAAINAGSSVNGFINKLLMQSCGLSEQEWKKAKDQTETV